MGRMLPGHNGAEGVDEGGEATLMARRTRTEEASKRGAELELSGWGHRVGVPAIVATETGLRVGRERSERRPLRGNRGTQPQ